MAQHQSSPSLFPTNSLERQNSDLMQASSTSQSNLDLNSLYSMSATPMGMQYNMMQQPQFQMGFTPTRAAPPAPAPAPNFSGFPASPASQNFAEFSMPQNPTTPIPIQHRLLSPSSSSGITPSQSTASFTEPGPITSHDATGTSAHSLEFLVKNDHQISNPARKEELGLEPSTPVDEPANMATPSGDDIGFEPINDAANNDVIEVMDGEKALRINKKDGSVVRPQAPVKEEPTMERPGFATFFRRNRTIPVANLNANANAIVTNPLDNNNLHPEGRTGGNEQKFMGEGQIYKGKLIGVLAVQEARGDRMCQDALQELKMAIKASGEHKQKVIIHIAVDGLKIRDEKSGDCLYHHPVHKISFIAQDMADNRAFGYIYGSPENGHRFFGIKTEKQAGQVVVAMRDLFQVVFELKKKEIDEAKEQLSKDRRELMQQALQQQQAGQGSVATFPEQAMGLRSQQPDIVPTSSGFDDLLGLESQLTSIQAGIHQIDNITPNTIPMTLNTDSMMPLGGQMSQAQAMTSMVSSGPQMRVAGGIIVSSASGTTQKTYPQAIMNTGPVSKPDSFGATPFLPPPPSRSRQRPGEGNPPQQQPQFQNQSTPFGNYFQGANQFSQPQVQQQTQQVSTAQQQAPAGSHGFNGFSNTPFQPSSGQIMDPNRLHSTSDPVERKSDSSGVFTDLDPLGVGKGKAFVDKKDFFSEKKSPTQRVPMSAMTGGSLSPTQSSDALSSVGSERNPSSSSQVYQPSPLATANAGGFADTFSFSDSLSGGSSFGTHIQPPSEKTFSTSNVNQNQVRRHRDSPALWSREQTDMASFGTRTKNPSGYFTTGRPGSGRYASVPINVSSQSGTRSLKVSLPPEETQAQKVDPRYGSIPHLESSPRRYCKQDSMDDQPRSSPDRIPPKLPDKPSKTLSNGSPPPLPPKKPVSQQNSWRSTEPEPQAAPSEAYPREDIYDFPPEPMIGKSNLTQEESRKCITDILCYNQSLQPQILPVPSITNYDITLEELSKMSVMELNDKMQRGQLPQELKGMSIFELVEHISSELQTSKKRTTNASQDTMEVPSLGVIKPSFSDNFVSASALPADLNQVAQKVPIPKLMAIHLDDERSISSMSPGPPSAMRLKEGDDVFDLGVSGSALESPQVDKPKSLGSSPAPPKVPPRPGEPPVEPIAPNFDDNFAEDEMTKEEREQKEKNDRYAVLREFQIEEDMRRALESPSDELVNQDRETDDELEIRAAESKGDQQNKVEEDSPSSWKEEQSSEYFEPRVCSSEGSPCSDSGSDKADSEEDDDPGSAELEVNHPQEELEGDFERDEDRKRDSQIPLCHPESSDMNLSRNGSQRSDSRGNSAQPPMNPDDSFEHTFGHMDNQLVSKETSGWAKFDEGPDSLELSHESGQFDSSTPSHTYSPRKNVSLSEKTQPHMAPFLSQGRIRQPSRSSQDGFESDLEVQKYSQPRSNHTITTTPFKSRSSLDWWPASGESPSRGDRKPRLQQSNRGGSANPFGSDSFTPPMSSFQSQLSRSHTPVTPSAFQRENSHRYEDGYSIGSNLSEIEQPTTNGNIFDAHFEDVQFKVHAKVLDDTAVPKSDSINIFDVKDDPFDDDFFH
ncbi:uncharacterized protein LOC131893139 [Tigriopus californicus]|nr:uncharacterized protein LOC131893139 [Tigriopus californicus]